MGRIDGNGGVAGHGGLVVDEGEEDVEHDAEDHNGGGEVAGALDDAETAEAAFDALGGSAVSAANVHGAGTDAALAHPMDEAFSDSLPGPRRGPAVGSRRCLRRPWPRAHSDAPRRRTTALGGSGRPWRRARDGGDEDDRAGRQRRDDGNRTTATGSAREMTAGPSNICVALCCARR